MSVTDSDVVVIKWDETILARARDRANKKSEWVDTWKKRTKEQRALDFLDGQLGEEGFRIFLEKEGIEYIYYDDIRTDGFLEKDLFDFKLLSAKGEIEVSVKSSKLKKGISKTIDENNLLAYPRQVKPVIIQPFIDHGEGKIFLAGWASKMQMEAITPDYLPGFFSDRGVKYHKIIIKNANPMHELKQFINK